jgi:hypothetical protein
MENSNNQFVDAPYQALPIGQNIPPPRQQNQYIFPNGGYNQPPQPNYAPNLGYNQGFQPNQVNPGYQPPYNQGFVPNSLPNRIPCPYCRR